MNDLQYKNVQAMTQTLEYFNVKLHNSLVKVEQLQNTVTYLIQTVTSLQNTVNQLRAERTILR